MTVLAKGIAHISFTGGGTFLPARNPYDREILIDHVAHSARAKGRVQVQIDDQLWLVCGIINGGRTPEACSGCGYALETACYFAADAEYAYCVKCAFGPCAGSIPAKRRRLRQAS